MIHLRSWDIDLGKLPSSATGLNCYRAGEHDPKSGRDVLYTLPAVGGTFLKLFDDPANGGTLSNVVGDSPRDLSNPYSVQASKTFLDPRIQAVSTYPGFEPGSSGALWKGPVFCVHQTILEKFSNNRAGYQTTVTLTPGSGNPGPFPPLVVLERETGTFAQQALKSPALLTAADPSARLSDNNTVPLQGGASTRGWADGNLLTALVFDGSEVAGTYKATLSFTLADFTAPASP